MADEPRDAKAYIRGLFQQWGLVGGGLADRIFEELGEKGVDSPQEVMLWLQDQPEFHERFKGAAIRRERGLRPMSPAEYLDLEQQYRQIANSAGLPGQFYDNPDDFAGLIGNDISIDEFAERVQEGYQRVAQSSPAIRDKFAEYFGIRSDAELAKFFMDPERSTAEATYHAEIAEASGIAALGGINMSQKGAEALLLNGGTIENLSRLSDLQHLTKFVPGDGSKMTANDIPGKGQAGQLNPDDLRSTNDLSPEEKMGQLTEQARQARDQNQGPSMTPADRTAYGDRDSVGDSVAQLAAGALTEGAKKARQTMERLAAGGSGRAGGAGETRSGSTAGSAR